MSERRRANLRRLVAAHNGPKAFSKKAGVGESFLCQMTGPNPSRGVSEDTCRKIELNLGLPAGSLDVAVRSPGHVPGPQESVALMQALAAACQERVPGMPSQEFAKLATYVLTDWAETAVPWTRARMDRLLELLER